ncbi:hypothetical protein CONPUDRAFT_75887 [Coniophora puteana RWD-64-598 SS2]|uniref:Uncharacterized protein n=1 Tax=Coniophora puteana (strain RWD-64-598) TaxID=741705 RepID=A0A5M3MCW4_CONPW|nr:uncharacterized protein CONPUDRAFT_75887 [Coniophora puteana RWD-64-598 SS2]EIW77079.1 hypothetical protein CONPUDRAFT_75887 [Coniophora puteana RWD-64-598 SS2]
MDALPYLHLIPGEHLSIPDRYLPQELYLRFLLEITLAYKDCERHSRSENTLYGLYQKILSTFTDHIQPHPEGVFILYGQRHMDSDTAYELHRNVQKYLVVIPDFSILHLRLSQAGEIQQRCRMLIEIKRSVIPSQATGGYRPYFWLTEHSRREFNLAVRGSLRQILLQAFVAFHTFPDDPVMYVTFIAGAHFALFEVRRPDNLESLPQENNIGDGPETADNALGEQDPDYGLRNSKDMDDAIVSEFIPQQYVRLILYDEPTVERSISDTRGGLTGISPAFAKCFLTALPPGFGVLDNLFLTTKLKSISATNFASDPARWTEANSKKIHTVNTLLDTFYAIDNNDGDTSTDSYAGDQSISVSSETSYGPDASYEPPRGTYQAYLILEQNTEPRRSPRFN